MTAVRWWRRLTAAEPGNSRAVEALVTSLAATGDRAGALQVAAAHEAFLRSEFDAPPDPALSAVVKGIREGRGAGVAPERRIVPNDAPLEHMRGTDAGETVPSGRPTSHASRTRGVASASIIGALIAVAAIIGLVDRRRAERDAPAHSERRIAVTPFRNETGDSALAFYSRHSGT